MKAVPRRSPCAARPRQSMAGKMPRTCSCQQCCTGSRALSEPRRIWRQCSAQISGEASAQAAHMAVLQRKGLFAIRPRTHTPGHEGTVTAMRSSIPFGSGR